MTVRHGTIYSITINGVPLPDVQIKRWAAFDPGLGSDTTVWAHGIIYVTGAARFNHRMLFHTLRHPLRLRKRRHGWAMRRRARPLWGRSPLCELSPLGWYLLLNYCDAHFKKGQ